MLPPYSQSLWGNNKNGCRRRIVGNWYPVLFVCQPDNHNRNLDVFTNSNASSHRITCTPTSLQPYGSTTKIKNRSKTLLRKKEPNAEHQCGWTVASKPLLLDSSHSTAAIWTLSYSHVENRLSTKRGNQLALLVQLSGIALIEQNL